MIDYINSGSQRRINRVRLNTKQSHLTKTGLISQSNLNNHVHQLPAAIRLGNQNLHGSDQALRLIEKYWLLARVESNAQILCEQSDFQNSFILQPHIFFPCSVFFLLCLKRVFPIPYFFQWGLLFFFFFLEIYFCDFSSFFFHSFFD